MTVTERMTKLLSTLEEASREEKKKRQATVASRTAGKFYPGFTDREDNARNQLRRSRNNLKRQTDSDYEGTGVNTRPSDRIQQIADVLKQGKTARARTHTRSFAHEYMAKRRKAT